VSAHPFATADAPSRIADPGDRRALEPDGRRADEHRLAGWEAREVLPRYPHDARPRRQHIQYALIEISDESRHRIAVAKITESHGVPDYRPRWYAHGVARKSAHQQESVR